MPISQAGKNHFEKYNWNWAWVFMSFQMGSASKFYKFIENDKNTLTKCWNNLGWAGQHSRFTLGFHLGFPMDLPNEIWFMVLWNTSHWIFLSVLWLDVFFILVWSPQLKFKIWGRSDLWLLNNSTFNILRSSSIGGHLHLKQFFNLSLDT